MLSTPVKHCVWYALLILPAGKLGQGGRFATEASRSSCLAGRCLSSRLSCCHCLFGHLHLGQEYVHAGSLLCCYMASQQGVLSDTPALLSCLLYMYMFGDLCCSCLILVAAEGCCGALLQMLSIGLSTAKLVCFCGKHLR